MKTHPNSQHRSKVGWHSMLETLDLVLALVDPVGRELTMHRPTERLIILIYQDVRQYIGRQSPKGYMIFPLVNPFIHHVHSKTRLSDSMNYKTGFYTNLADVTANLVCWSNILTCAHDILTFQTCFLQTIESDKEICASTLQKSAELTDRQTSWYWFVRQIRSCFWN